MIELEGLSIVQGNFSLNDINISIPQNAYAVLTGQTGSGKTSLIETICGLRRSASGRVLIEGRDVSRLPPSLRQIGYVPQDSVLFPTMTVERQIGFGLEVRSANPTERNKRIREVAEMLQLTSLLKRVPYGLSGGEMQRVALARAISFRPRVLCLDEPLSALDVTNRQSLIELLHEVHQTEQITVLHITHSSTECQQLGTMEIRLADGKIEPVKTANSASTRFRIRS